MRRHLIYVMLIAAWLNAFPVGCTKNLQRSGTVNEDRTPIVVAEGQLFPAMGPLRRPVTTQSAKAQAFFDQGLTWTYAFNHDEAIRSFTEATKQDADCAAAYWGIALCYGPHINNPVVPENKQVAAWEAVQVAMTLRDRVSPVERALIEALATRYSESPVSDRRALDEAYAEAMGNVWQAYPKDADVDTLYAEALMDLQPWDLWEKNGSPKGRAEEIVATLEQVLAYAPYHPGANHLYIHAVEASRQPERAEAAADRLREMVPISSHLTHMPSHIDVRVGRWQMAADQNEKARDAAKRYTELSPRQGFYRIYMLHNTHFLAYAAMMEGCREKALAAAQEMVNSIPEAFIQSDAALVDAVMMIVTEVQMRFGMWDEILKEPKPRALLPNTVAFWHMARGVAMAAKGDVSGARAEQAALHKHMVSIPCETMMMINRSHDVLAIADLLLEGEILYREGRIDEAVAKLREAATREDALIYMEPPDWIQPIRHTLGAVLLSAGRWGEAETVYREDLIRWPENGWSLHGMAQCKKAQKKLEDAAIWEARFRKAWSRADTTIGSSCLCVPEVKLSAGKEHRDALQAKGNRMLLHNR